MNQELLNKYINGTASKEERAIVSEWMKIDREHLNDVTALRKLQNITIWNQLGKSTKRKGTNHKLYYSILSAVATLAIFISIGFYYLFMNADSTMQTINVPPGQRAEVLLADGTSVWLNAGSSLNFPTNFSKKQREVFLDGEAYFDVKKESERDFIVKTTSFDIKVLGTTFNVMAYKRSKSFEVSLLSGLVEVFSPFSSEKVSLEPNTRVFLSDQKLVKSEIKQFDHFLWKDGLICFDDESFEDMVDKLELYFDTKIIIDNTDFHPGKYTGKFRTKDGIEHILRVIQLKEKFIYEKDIDENTITIK